MSTISYDESSRSWLIGLASSSYAFCVSDEGSLRHLHWGAPLGSGTVAALTRDCEGPALQRTRDLAWSKDAPDEYVGWGGMRYDEPTLKVTYADGDRGLDLSVAGHRIAEEDGAALLEIDLVDGDRLAVTLHYRAAHGFDVLERWATIRNTGVEEVDVRLAASASWWLPAYDGPWRLRYEHGGWGMEHRLGDVMLATPGKFTLESRRGMTGHQHTPWFTLDRDGAATEETGEVWSGQVAWSGSWKIVAERTAADRMHVAGGWNDFDLSYRLAVGQETALPVFAGLHTADGLGGASRAWHDWTRARVLPSIEVSESAPPRLRDAGPWRPVLYNSWEATAFDVTEEGQRALAERAAGIGVELFVVDDGWFPGRPSATGGLGDWRPDPQKFPNGLEPLIDRVHELGMGFGLWVEPEMVSRDSDLFRAHPDWAYRMGGREPVERRHQLMLNLARPDVADWVLETVDGLLARYDISFLKWDANRNIADAGWAGSDNPERLWVEHTRSLYRILDALRAAHPSVLIEGCAGGGARVDLGILGHVHQVSSSDNTEPSMRWDIHDGYSQAFPPGTTGTWVSDWPHYGLERPLPLAQRFHVAMAGALGVGGDLTRWSEEDLAEAAAHIERYKEIRPVVQGGRMHRHGEAWELVAADDSEVVVIAFWRDRPIGNHRPPVRLTGVDATARYRDDTSGTSYDGSLLREVGLTLPGADGFGFGSALLRLIKED
ncbi:MAG: alpha-galactosidase [Nocardioidaceae bacterium]|nr:alpha-galactosidase [Nocardioidaceae bacterium]MCL2613590.1 alpha-galactosidase [Nocardioidaceae bacterium]